jgi:hypothetical protein
MSFHVSRRSDFVLHADYNGEVIRLMQDMTNACVAFLDFLASHRGFGYGSQWRGGRN